jgi:hypothetical protein
VSEFHMRLLTHYPGTGKTTVETPSERFPSIHSTKFTTKRVHPGGCYGRDGARGKGWYRQTRTRTAAAGRRSVLSDHATLLVDLADS